MVKYSKQAAASFLRDSLKSVIKSIVFSLIVIWIVVYKGYVESNAVGMSRATIKTAVYLFMTVLVLNFILTVFMTDGSLNT
ncbi:MAG: ABC transporter permease [Coxiella endosymbiont of Dermacentor nuttalli]